MTIRMSNPHSLVNVRCGRRAIPRHRPRLHVNRDALRIAPEALVAKDRMRRIEIPGRCGLAVSGEVADLPDKAGAGLLQALHKGVPPGIGARPQVGLEVAAQEIEWVCVAMGEKRRDLRATFRNPPGFLWAWSYLKPWLRPRGPNPSGHRNRLTTRNHRQ
jgi:hypothetical protein